MVKPQTEKVVAQLVEHSAKNPVGGGFKPSGCHFVSLDKIPNFSVGFLQQGSSALESVIRRRLSVMKILDGKHTS